MLERLKNLLGLRNDDAPASRPESALRRTGALDRAVRARPGPKSAPAPAVAVANGKRPTAAAGRQDTVELGDGGPGKNVLIRNRYLREDSGTHETLRIIDDSALDTGETTGIDPYNTGRFDRSKNWDRRFRD